MGLVFPHVEHGLADLAVAEGPLDGLRSYHLAARGVDEQRLAAERLEETVVGQVIGAVGPRSRSHTRRWTSSESIST